MLYVFFRVWYDILWDVLSPILTDKIMPKLKMPGCWIPELVNNDQLRHSISRHYIMASSNGNIFHVTGPLCGEFTGPGEFPTQRPVTQSFDVFFDMCLNKWLSKQPWGWWFETPSWSLWRQCNEIALLMLLSFGIIFIDIMSTYNGIKRIHIMFNMYHRQMKAAA